MIEMNASAWEEYENHYKAGMQDGYLKGIDACIDKIKEEWSIYNETCYEIVRELEQLKRLE